MKFTYRKCNNCQQAKLSIVRIFFILHGILDNQLNCNECKIKYKINKKTLDKYKYFSILLGIIYMTIFLSSFSIVYLVKGLFGGILGFFIGISLILLIEYIIAKNIEIEKIQG